MCKDVDDAENRITLIVPAGMFGASEFDTDLDFFLRKLASACDTEDEWPDKYGATFENDVFMMHPYCWCEQDGCPWCDSCECPESARHYLVDGEEVSFHVWRNFYFDRIDEGFTYKEVAARRERRHDAECAFCLGEQHADRGAIAGRPAPNFWHKPSALRVWWYKYIGRDVIVENPNDLHIGEMMAECFRSLMKIGE